MTDIKHICAELASLAVREHYSCEDSWYSCPKAEGGCANDTEGDECKCGSDAHNAKISELLATALAEPEPQGPTDEELRQLRRENGWPLPELLIFSIARAVLARWGPVRKLTP